MISWSPACHMLKHINTGVIRIPLGNLFSNYKLDSITTKSDEIIIHILEKNHILLDKDAVCVREMGQEINSSQYKDRQTLQ